MSAKFTLTQSDDNGVVRSREYSRRIDAVRAGEKSDLDYTVRNAKSAVVAERMASRPAVDTAAVVAKLDAAEVAEAEAVGAGIEQVAAKAAAKVDAMKGRNARTWTVSGPDATHKCAGACGTIKPLKAFPTTKKNGQRGVECRACRDARKG